MKLMHASGFSLQEREAFRGFVFSNMVGAMQAILSAMADNQVALTHSENEVSPIQRCISSNRCYRVIQGCYMEQRPNFLVELSIEIRFNILDHAKGLQWSTLPTTISGGTQGSLERSIGAASVSSWTHIRLGR